MTRLDSILTPGGALFFARSPVFYRVKFYGRVKTREMERVFTPEKKGKGGGDKSCHLFSTFENVRSIFSLSRFGGNERGLKIQVI